MAYVSTRVFLVLQYYQGSNWPQYDVWSNSSVTPVSSAWKIKILKISSLNWEPGLLLSMLNYPVFVSPEKNKNGFLHNWWYQTSHRRYGVHFTHYHLRKIPYQTTCICIKIGAVVMCAHIVAAERGAEQKTISLTVVYPSLPSHGTML